MTNFKISEKKSITGLTKLKNKGEHSKMKWTDAKEKIDEKFRSASEEEEATIIKFVANQAEDTNISVFPMEKFNDFFKKAVGDDYLKLAKMVDEASQYDDFCAKFSWVCYDNKHGIITTVDDPTHLIERYINSDDDIIETIAQNENLMKILEFPKDEIKEIKESYENYIKSKDTK